MCIGLAVIVIMIIWPKKLNEKIPSSLAALIIILIAVSYTHLDVYKRQVYRQTEAADRKI